MPNSKSKIFELIESKLDSLIKNVYVTVKRYKFTTAALLLLLIFGLFAWLKFSNSQANQFPFISEIWGTVSDWVSVFVTISSVLLLYFTLNHQLGVNKVESINRQKLLKPVISIRFNKKFNQANLSKKISMSFLTRGNPYRRFSFLMLDKMEEGGFKWDFKIKTGPVHPEEDILMYDDVELEYILREGKAHPDIANFGHFFVVYQDQIGNIYCDLFKLEDIWDINNIRVKRYPNYQTFSSFNLLHKKLVNQYHNKFSEESLNAFTKNWNIEAQL